jgi:hypothetical protein
MSRFVLSLVVLAIGPIAVAACDTDRHDREQASAQRSGPLVTSREGVQPIIQLTVDFRFTGEEFPHRYEVDCGPRSQGDASSTLVCEQISQRKAVLLPSEEPECPLPVPTLYIRVEGTAFGKRLRQTLTPCSDTESRAITAWAETLDFKLKEPRTSS